MFKLFENKYKSDSSGNEVFNPLQLLNKFRSKSLSLEMNVLMKKHGGKSFNRGIYRIVRAEDFAEFVEIIGSAFPEFLNRFIPFGYDWTGRFFALKKSSQPDERPFVLMFDINTNEVLEIPGGIATFHNQVLVEQDEPALEAQLFPEFLKAASISSLSHDQCADMVLPLCMGGEFSVKNMKVLDLRVSWEFSKQLLLQLKNVKTGTRIEEVSIDKDDWH